MTKNVTRDFYKTKADLEKAIAHGGPDPDEIVLLEDALAHLESFERQLDSVDEELAWKFTGVGRVHTIRNLKKCAMHVTHAASYLGWSSNE